jgi:hypothetical protein
VIYGLEKASEDDFDLWEEENVFDMGRGFVRSEIVTAFAVVTLILACAYAHLCQVFDYTLTAGLEIWALRRLLVAGVVLLADP